MTPERQTIALGEQARALLDNPTFMSAIGGFMNMHLEAIMGSHDDAAEVREKHFRQFRAYENVAADLKARVQAMEEFLAERNATPEDED